MMGRTQHSNFQSCEKTVDTIDAVQLLHSDHLLSALPFLQKQSKSKSISKSISKSKAKAKAKQKKSKSKAKAKQKKSKAKGAAPLRKEAVFSKTDVLKDFALD